MGGMDRLEAQSKLQFGIVSRAQVTEALGSRSAIRWRVATGELKRLHELAFRLRGVPESWESTAMAGLFIGGEGSALSHRTAAYLHRLDGFREPKIIDVSTHWNGPRKFAGIHFHRTRPGPGDPVLCNTLPVTTIQRTIVDLAAELESEALELALDSAQLRHERFGDWLTDYISQLNPRFTPGLAELKLLLELRRGVSTESWLEVKVKRALRKAGLSDPVTQLEVYDEHGYVMRLDFAWPHLKVALHVDSYRWHNQRQRFDRDARQRARLQKAGWTFLTITWTTFQEGHWLDQLRALLKVQSELSLGC